MESEISNITDHIFNHITKSENQELKRVLHGRGGTFEGLRFLNVDFFPPALLITLYDEKTDLWKKNLAESLLSHPAIQSLVIQDRSAAPWKSELFGLPLPEEHIVTERGLRYRVSLVRGENPGIFPDMSEGRSLVRSIAQGRKVLNLFSYTCAFSVAAIAGEADSVLNMDMNRNSLNRGRDNHRLNEQDLSKVSFLDHNILKSFGKITRQGPFDLVIVDPPPSQGTSFKLERDYGKILRKSREFLSEGGELIACLNSPRLDFSWFESFISENFGEHELLERLHSGNDFPESDPDRGLKIIHFRI